MEIKEYMEPDYEIVSFSFIDIICNSKIEETTALHDEGEGYDPFADDSDF